MAREIPLTFEQWCNAGPKPDPHTFIGRDERSTLIMFTSHYDTCSTVWSVMYCTNTLGGACGAGDFVTRDDQCIHVDRGIYNSYKCVDAHTASWRDYREWVRIACIDLTYM